MSTNSTVLQLRQQESTDVTVNGVWKSTLDYPVELNEGDMVSVKSVYLDTVVDVIEISEDTSVTMEAVMWIQNYRLDQEYVFKGDTFNAGSWLKLYQGDTNGTVNRTPNNQGDNQRWFASIATTTAADAHNWYLPQMIVVPTDGRNDTKRFGNITLTFQYTPITPGAKQTTSTVHLKSYIDKRWNNHNPRSLGITCTGTATGPIIKLLTPASSLAAAGIQSVNFLDGLTELTAGQVEIEPLRFPISFVIPQGTYTPPEIAQFITDKVSNLEYEGKVSIEYGADSAADPITKTEWPSMNPWLKSVLQLTQQVNLTDSESKLIFVNADSRYGGPKGGGGIYFQYDLGKMKGEWQADPYRPPLDKFIGTNQFLMEFDQVENKIKITQMHFPLYVNDTEANDGDPGIVFNNVQDGDIATDPVTVGQGNMFRQGGGIASAYSGIAFTSLTPASFWDNLGFGNLTVTPNKNAKMNFPLFTSPDPTGFNSYTLNVDPGKTITSGFVGNDLPVDHANLYKASGTTINKFGGIYSVPRFDAHDGYDQYISTTDVSSIFSSKTINDDIASEGYFTIEIGSNFRQELIGGKFNQSKETQSIVNRYYSSGSFTSDQGAGSIGYIHHGSPQMLNNLSIKVRNPDGSFVDNSILKEKNTVFIEIQRAAPKPPTASK